MSKRIAEAFRNGEYVQPRISTEAARWLLTHLEHNLKIEAPRGWVRDYLIEILGTLQCELDELK